MTSLITAAAYESMILGYYFYNNWPEVYLSNLVF